MAQPNWVEFPFQGPHPKGALPSSTTARSWRATRLKRHTAGAVICSCLVCQGGKEVVMDVDLIGLNLSVKQIMAGLQ